MAHAILMLSDDGQAIAANVSWEGPFDKTSPSHQHMALLLKHLDGIAQRIPDQEPAATEVAEAAAKSVILNAAGRPVRLAEGE